MVYNFQQHGWDWDMLPMHPATQQQYRPPTTTSTAKPPTNVSGQPTAFQQQQAQQSQQAEMKRRLEEERKRREKMLLEQQKQFTQKRDQMAGQITDVATRQKFLYQQSQAEREFRLARAGLDNPILRTVNQKIKYQPGMFRGVSSRQLPEFLNAWMAQWGRHKKRDAETLGYLGFSIIDNRKHPPKTTIGAGSNGYQNRYKYASFQDGTPEPTSGDYSDPCTKSNLTEAEKQQCYISQLGNYGISLMSGQDMETYKKDLGIDQTSLEQFDSNQLKTILEGVRKTGEMFVQYLGQLGVQVSPEEAFKLIYGETVKFGYVPGQKGNPGTEDKALTVATGAGTEPMNPDQPIFIMLDDTSFGDFRGLDSAFVVVHELGHAFHNRQGGKTEYGIAPIAASGFVRATKSLWYPEPTEIAQPNLPGVGNLVPVVMQDGTQKKDPQGNLLYWTPQEGYYYSQGYAGAEEYFPNETRAGNPTEGFADSFANFILNFDQIEGTPRGNYFQENMEGWIQEIYSRQHDNNISS